MIVKILRESRRLKGKAGDEVECDAVLGNYLAGIGCVQIVKHDPAKGPKATVKRSGKETVKDDVQ